jgi:hypothetical protein
MGPALAAVDANVARDIAPAPTRGTATLVLQTVTADCGSSHEGPEPRTFLVGQDLLVRMQGEDPATRPAKEYVFCPSHAPDGGAQKPQLSTWDNCRAFSGCQIVNQDAASSASRVEIQCGKEHVVLESDSTHTILRGSFGERELAPYPMKISPVKREARVAMVDC